MKTYKFIKTSTAGNITCFILGEKAFEEKENVLSILISKKNLDAEQFGFLWEENGKVRMEMAGGEISGGAVLASPVVDIDDSRRKICSANIEVSSLSSSIIENRFSVEGIFDLEMIMEYPQKLFSKVLNVSGYKVVLDGIAYFVTDGNFLNKKFSKKLFQKIDVELKTVEIPAIGVIFVNKNRIKPIVWVKSLGTIFEEKGCTTGTISAELSYPSKKGVWIQPSGLSIRAIIDSSIKVNAKVEKLAEGIVYLSKI